MEDIQKSITELIDLFNELKATYDAEKIHLFDVSKALCDNTKIQDEKIKLLEEKFNSLNESIDSKINNIRLSVLKINQALDTTVKNCNINTDVLLERIKKLEKLDEVEVFEEMNRKLSSLEDLVKQSDVKKVEQMLHKFTDEYTNKITTLEAHLKPTRSVADLICIVYNQCVKLLFWPFRRHLEKKRKLAEEAEKLRLSEEAKIRKQHEEEERKRIEKELEQQQIAQIQNILGKSNKRKNGGK